MAEPRLTVRCEFPNRPAVEREIESAENPQGMQLNDGKERVRLPAGTLRYMLAKLDAQASLIARLEGKDQPLILTPKNCGCETCDGSCMHD